MTYPSLLRYWKCTEDDDAVFRLALAIYGPRLQTLVAIEEMSELQKELVKHERGADNVPHIAEEIADVQIMLLVEAQDLVIVSVRALQFLAVYL